MVNWGKVILAGVVFVFVFVAATADTPREYKGWGLDQEKEQVKRREDPTAWDKEMLEQDKVLSKVLSKGPGSRPFAFGTFPVPQYDLVGKGSCGGNGNLFAEHPWRDHYVLSNTFFVGRSPVNEKFVGDRKDEVFFHILVLADKKLDGSNVASNISSRNHPHYIGQGQFKTSRSEVYYVAFQTADRNAYAVVNMRLFDLRAGRVVIITPQKDGTLRSMQVEAPTLSSAEVKDFDAKLLKEPGVIKFLDSTGKE
ncbi:hypothetical protein [Fimbriiglobus ruber]|uniref:Uncharacterized protein n=1 Tax=Fimbriiglobus ruber TaxID=1908690 RepID=A0A225E030_9BACT|nr:hypothetical protein [Fimbriiglobus ruber]OWK46951.1 hypothetical protein FRUB_00650 [Fimbriiglobus ruber]